MNEIKGTVASVGNMKGNLNAASGFDGDSAYEVAVKNGFEGTEAEWLKSLSGVYIGSGDMPPNCNVQIDPIGEAITIEQIIKTVIEQTSKISSVTLLENQWEGTASPYSQVVTVAGATKNSKVDLNPTVEQLNIFHNKDIAFVVENNNGVITVYCIGQKPTNDYTVQATITEVYVNG